MPGAAAKDDGADALKKRGILSDGAGSVPGGRALLIAVVLALGWLATGCRISRHIENISPPPQPPLRQLGEHLEYDDPDAGQPDYLRPHEK